MIRTTSRIAVAALAIASSIVPSCATKPPLVSPTTAPGISYQLPKTIFEVQAKRTDTEQNLVEDGVLKSKPAVEVAGDVTTRTVADGDRRSLDLVVGSFADGALTVATSPEGFLTAINSTVEGKGGTVLTNIFTILGRVLGIGTLVAGARAPGDPPDTIIQPEPVACNETGLPKEMRKDAFLENGAPDPSFFAGDMSGHFFVTHSQRGCAAWKELLTARSAVRSQMAAVQKEEGALKGTATSDQAKRIESRIRHAETVLRRFQATESERAAAYDAVLADFKKGFGMNPKTTAVVEMRESFALSELPSNSLFAALDKTSLATALQAKHKKMHDLLAAGVVLAVLDPLPAAKDSACGTNDVMYRDPVVVRIVVYRADKGRDFKKVDERSVVAFDGPPRCAKIEQSSFANRALVMEFGDFGVPKKLQRTNSSVAAAATGAVSSALASLTNTYAESLEKVIAIQGSRRTIDQSDLADQIGRLTKQKELIDAQILVEGTTASKELVLQQKLAEQQLALLQKELDLKKFGQGVDAQLELAGLKDRIALLEQQLALIIAQRKIDEANKP